MGSGAFLGRVESETRCAFWAQEPIDHGFEPALLISVDLAMTPTAALEGRIPWDTVQVDDCFTGPNGQLSGSTLGPRWPELNMFGATYLEQRFVAQIPSERRPACPPVGLSGRDYEHMTVLYWPHVDDPRAGKRYAGHHAEIIEERGSLARVAVFPPGTSDVQGARPLTMWIDLADSAQCDAGANSLTSIAVGSGPKQGPLYLISGSIGEPDGSEQGGHR